MQLEAQEAKTPVFYVSKNTQARKSRKTSHKSP